MKNKFIIGMDGGGTKTHAVIANLNGDILAEHTAGPSNFQIIGVEKTAEAIYSLIGLCCESVECSVDQIVSVVLGLTGAGRVGDQKRMADGLKKYSAKRNVRLKKIIVESDARIALEGAFKGDSGIILIAGTGSIAFGKDAKGNVHRVGGWGRILGDEGSGYFIGRLGMTAVAHELDGRGEKTKLSTMIAKKFRLTDQSEIITAVYKDNFDIASIAPLVLKGAEENDAVCRMIVEQSAIELAEHVEVAAKMISASMQTKVKSKIHLAFIGGLIANETLLSELLRNYLSSNFPSIEIIQPMASPAYGAVVLGMKSSKKITRK
ncbi:MAG: BadF/BadG/BcrA/BcrD ATPase family protein [Bacteroidota bacterium]|nr:BadF/BadG/BcrA/BcrD ATPase family protein [Bacteroidota bacterium]